MIETLHTFFFWPCHVACRILVPRPGIKLGPPAVEAQSPNHWPAREFLSFSFIWGLIKDYSPGDSLSGSCEELL